MNNTIFMLRNIQDSGVKHKSLVWNVCARTTGAV